MMIPCACGHTRGFLNLLLGCKNAAAGLNGNRCLNEKQGVCEGGRISEVIHR